MTMTIIWNCRDGVVVQSDEEMTEQEALDTAKRVLGELEEHAARFRTGIDKTQQTNK